MALAWQGLAGSALVLLWPSFFDLLGYQVFAEASFFALAAGAVFVFRSRGEPSPFRVPGYPWTPLAFIALNAAMLANSLWHQPLAGSIILGILAAGFPVYWIWSLLRPASSERTSEPPR
jgi:APA family basic amino acid/polyamine antiporter